MPLVKGADGRRQVHKRKRICIVASAPGTVTAFLRPHIDALADTYDVTVVANYDQGADHGLSSDVHVVPVAIPRAPNPWSDLQALFALVRLFRKEQYVLVHSYTPKAGLLAMAAAYAARTPNRWHTFTGQVWVTRRGLSRSMLKMLDRTTATLASFVLVDSPSQREFLIAERVVASHKSHVLGKGSVAGVDSQRFHPSGKARIDVRVKHGIGMDDLLFLFLGRLNRDKGVLELAEAFSMMSSRANDCRLVFVGPDEEDLTQVVSRLGGDGVLTVPPVQDPENYLNAADVLCLPSHREGFGNVVIEAASVGIPAVASRIYGLTDAVVDGETGILHPPGDVQAISEALSELAADTDRRLLLGNNARARALANFSQTAILGELRGLYVEALE